MYIEIYYEEHVFLYVCQSMSRLTPSVDVLLLVQFHMKGQISSEEAQSMLWQLIQALKYLHSIGVWHRDIKTSNIFITYDSGVRVVKLGDFGSARSAEDLEGMTTNDERSFGFHSAKSYQEMEKAMVSTDLYMQYEDNEMALNTSSSSAEKRSEDSVGRGLLSSERPGLSKQQSAPLLEGARGDSTHMYTSTDSDAIRQSPTYHTMPDATGSKLKKAAGFKAPLTRVVMTPMYRAPEVVMSRGNYTAAIDMWGAGCVFAELLHRVAHVGSASTPNLRVAPLFALRGKPPARSAEQGSFGSPDAPGTRKELKALFSVIGTPSKYDIGCIDSKLWREYIERLGSLAPSLYRRFRYSGEVAVHLLSRLLEFSPERRASSEEALEHEYFAELRATVYDVTSAAADMAEPIVNEPRQMTVDTGDTSSKSILNMAPPSLDEYGEHLISARPSLAIDVAAAEASLTPMITGIDVDIAGDVPSDTSFGGLHSEYWREEKPGRALALLEKELEAAAAEAEASRTMEGAHRLRTLLEAECRAVAEATAADAVEMDHQSHQEQRVGDKDAHATMQGSKVSVLGLGVSGKGSVRDMLHRHGPGLLEDVAATAVASAHDFGQNRLSNIADTWQGRELDPRKFLGPGRHGEWTAQGGGGVPGPGPRWGVTSMPPGVCSDDPRLQEAVKKQQVR